jgi:hypothetical protein
VHEPPSPPPLKLTSSIPSTVTLKVLGTARNALLVLASVYIFGDLVSGTQFIGCVRARALHPGGGGGGGGGA